MPRNRSIIVSLALAAGMCRATAALAQQNHASVPGGFAPKRAKSQKALSRLLTNPKTNRAAWPMAKAVRWGELDVMPLVAQDQERDGTPGIPMRIGINRPTPNGVVSSQGHGSWTKLGNGTRVWTVELRAAEAKGLRVHFSQFNLPDGARLVARGATGEAGHAYRGKGLASKGSFWSAAIPGEVVYIEYQDPTGRAGDPTIEIDKISHIYRGDGFGVSRQKEAAAAGLLPCEEDVNCHAVDQTAKDSVGRISFTRPGEGTFLCSGALLNDADSNTFAGYFLTANHCLDTQVMVDSLEVRWFYQTDACNGTPSWISTSTGGTLLATSPNTDFTFIRLANDPSDGQGFASWTTTAPSGTVRGIHHPEGDYKRFSEGLVTTAQPICDTCCDKPLFRYVYNDWTIGVTEAGSSGSPLFNTSWQVVGQFWGTCVFQGTTPGCSNPEEYNNVYGRFEETYSSISSYLNTITPDDSFEDNDSLAQAAKLEVGMHSLRLVDFDDYFRVSVCGSNTLTATGTFNTADMDLDLELLTSAGVPLDVSNGITGTETVSASVGPGDYIVHATKISGWGGDYTLEVSFGTDCDDGNACTDDICNSGTCVHVINYDVGTECCNPVSGSVVVIDDGDICTVDTCDPVTGLVSHNPIATTFPAVVRVKGDAFGANDGTSWNDAFTDLQTALQAATCMPGDVDEIWVVNGVYHPDQGSGQSAGDRSATFGLLGGVGLYGGFVGTESAREQRNPALYPTILTGDLDENDTQVVCTVDANCSANGDRCLDTGFCIVSDDMDENAFHVVTGSGTDATAVLDGFTITAGHANGAAPDDDGAGMYNDAGSPTVANCTFHGNVATSDGAGMFNTNNSPIIARCTFSGNIATNQGGAMYNLNNGDATITDCIFVSNKAAIGGGCSVASSVPSIVNSVFNRNEAVLGGGLEASVNSDITVINCAFSGNRADLGGGMSNSLSSDPTLTNCSFSGNVATNDGGGMINTNSANPTLVHCTLSANTAVSEGGGIFNDGSNTTLTNSILWGNSDAGGSDASAQLHVFSGTPVVSFSTIQDADPDDASIPFGGAANKNLDDNPLFVRDPDDGGDGWGVGDNDDFGDLHQQSGSPAVDAADNDAVPSDSVDLDGDLDTGEPTPLDLDGNPRFLEDLLTVDTGNAGALGTPIVDMGAYEFLRDCNGNGIPDDQDLADCDPGDPACSDCNSNGILDECDIAGCDFLGACTALKCVGGYNDGAVCATDADCQLSCNDCDLNGVPDGCDDPVDNIPDDCVEAVSSGAWSADIWGLSGDFPDNVSSAASKNVTLDNATITLDIEVEIPTLRVLNGASLDITGHELRVVDPGGTVIDRTLPFSLPGNINSTIDVATGGVYNTRRLVLRGNRESDANGKALLTVDADATVVIGDPQGTTENALIIKGGGLYKAAAPGSAAGSLMVDSVLVLGGPVKEVTGGTMELTGSMTVQTEGNFTMDGTGADPCEQTGPRVPSRTPPILRIDGTLTIDGNLSLLGSVKITMEPTGSLEVGGNFDNRSTTPECIEWDQGQIVLGRSAAGLRAEQTFEVAGVDLGPIPEGLAPPGTTHGNYSIGTLTMPANAVVRFVDELDNDENGEGVGIEALYVRNLVVEAGAEVTIDRCNIYYEQLTNNGVINPPIPPGKLLPIGPAAAPLTAAFPHDRRKNRCISFDPNKAENDGANMAFKVELKQITLGSCDGHGGFCRADRGVDDCNECSIDGNPCINQAIDCSPGQTCEPTGGICVNDAPDIGGSNVGQTWWVGPESPLANGVHLLVSGAFRKISDDWPDPTHVGDCEIVPETVYGIRAVNTDSTAESDELLVETTLFATASSSWWADCVGQLRRFCGGDIRTAECANDGECTAPETCDRAWTLPDGSTNFDDVAAALAAAVGSGVQPDLTWVDLRGPVQASDPPNGTVNFPDIGQIIFAFGGFPYKGYDPADCPDVANWP